MAAAVVVVKNRVGGCLSVLLPLHRSDNDLPPPLPLTLDHRGLQLLTYHTAIPDQTSPSYLPTFLPKS